MQAWCIDLWPMGYGCPRFKMRVGCKNPKTVQYNTVSVGLLAFAQYMQKCNRCEVGRSRKSSTSSRGRPQESKSRAAERSRAWCIPALLSSIFWFQITGQFTEVTNDKWILAPGTTNESLPLGLLVRINSLVPGANNCFTKRQRAATPNDQDLQLCSGRRSQGGGLDWGTNFSTITINCKFCLESCHGNS